MKTKDIYRIELEDNGGRTFTTFDSYEDYEDYMSDLAVEAWDSRDEVNTKELFNFNTWVIVFDTNGDLRSLTPKQFKAQA